MKFYSDGVFHIYNQGNDKKQIFFYRENYEYFLWKLKKHLTLFGDVISWCLMPNHFHLLIRINQIEISRQEYFKHSFSIENERRLYYFGEKARLIENSEDYYQAIKGQISVNQSIGIMLGSYTQAINRRYSKTGSLFRKRCKAKDGMLVNLEYDHFRDWCSNPKDYITTVFHYIHDNPRKAGLVPTILDWEWSSVQDYRFPNRVNNILTNVEVGKTLVTDYSQYLNDLAG